MAYASAADLVNRYDARIIGDVIGDADQRVTEANLASNAKVQAALEDATGQIKSAATVANKYTEDSLQTLADAQDPLLVRMTCDLAMGYLLNRRHLSTEPYEAVRRAEDWLALLRLGERVLNLQENKDAGNVNAGYITTLVRSTLQHAADEKRYFPERVPRPTRSG